jgi:hypothetical protein
MVASNIKSMAVRKGDDVRVVPPALSVLRVADDGTLSFVRKSHALLNGDRQ